MHNIDITWFLDLTRRASDLAKSHFGNTRGTLKPDKTWVTQADIAVEAYLREELQKARPNDAILGEEGDNPPPESPVVWAIDPIDGTTNFVAGLSEWAVCIARLKGGRPDNGVPTVGAFALPALGDLYHTDGTTAYYNDVPLDPPAPYIDDNALFLVSEGAFESYDIDYPGKIISMGSAAGHLCYVARGSAVGALDKAGIWDYAASAAILRVLGVPFRYVSGSEVDFMALYTQHSVSEPTLVCPDSHFETLRSALKHLE